jgi:hypothetical protein
LLGNGTGERQRVCKHSLQEHRRLAGVEKNHKRWRSDEWMTNESPENEFVDAAPELKATYYQVRKN